MQMTILKLEIPVVFLKSDCQEFNATSPETQVQRNFDKNAVNGGTRDDG